MKELRLLYAFSELSITGNFPLIIRIIFAVYLAIKLWRIVSVEGAVDNRPHSARYWGNAQR